MNILVLGGTKFLGRHFVEAALAQGDRVTIFTRGKLVQPWGAAVTALVGNRDPAIVPGLTALAHGEWDAVVDFCGYVPRCVAASAQLLKGRVGCYLFVSSVSVYADASLLGLTETAATGEIPDPTSEEITKYYGPLKAACERAVERIYGADALIVRPGLIVGPYDPTDRFAYWVARFAAPSLLGQRPAQVVVPAPPERPIQVIDARDLATWMHTLLATGQRGTFNACSPPGHWTMRDLIFAAAAAGGTGSPQPVWIDEAQLLTHHVAPWTGLPLWLPSTSPEYAGFMAVDCAKATAAGLTCRPLAATVNDTADWLRTRATTGTFAEVLSAEQEREILASVPAAPTLH